MKYVILADSKSGNTFEIPRQLTKINGESLLKRTVRILRENGIEDILITSHDKRFEVEGATRYEPLHNDYDHITKAGYWLSAFPIELMNEPITFIWGDVYFSEDAIKKIVETETKSTLFFCTYQNKSTDYIKQHDEPLAYKVVDCELFKKHIGIVKKMYDDGLTVRHPIVWELYRSINGQDVNKHIMTKNYIAINDISCDIDSVKDIEELKIRLGGENMKIKVQALREFKYGDFNKITNLDRHDKQKNLKGRLYEKDVFECTKDMADYLTGKCGYVLVKIIEVIPEEPKQDAKIEENASTEKQDADMQVKEVKKSNKKRKKK